MERSTAEDEGEQKLGGEKDSRCQRQPKGFGASEAECEKHKRAQMALKPSLLEARGGELGGERNACAADKRCIGAHPNQEGHDLEEHATDHGQQGATYQQDPVQDGGTPRGKAVKKLSGMQ